MVIMQLLQLDNMIQVWDLDGQSMVAGFTGYEEGVHF